jgi:hypothetical protein
VVVLMVDIDSVIVTHIHTLLLKKTQEEEKEEELNVH